MSDAHIDVYEQAAAELRTVADYLRWATTTFSARGLHFGHGTDNAWDEAVALLTDALPFDHQQLGHVMQACLLPDERGRLAALVRRRVEDRVPVPYLTQTAHFAGESFYVDERVLIPRSPIAELILHEFAPWLDQQPDRVLDLCCGSGALGIAAALQFEKCVVDLTDLSEAALAVARINVDRFGLGDRVGLGHGDLWSAATGKYDLILSNPPYVPERVYAAIPDEFRREPKLALVADDEGMALLMRILAQAGDHLSDSGWLVLEAGVVAPQLDAMLTGYETTWPEFEHGGEGVVMLRAGELRRFQRSQCAQATP